MKKTKAEIIATFDPNGVGTQGSLFGLPFNLAQSEVVLIPVPWEVTVSYSAGTAAGPEAVLMASPQLDLYQSDIKDAWKTGIFLDNEDNNWLEISDHLREAAREYISWLEEGNEADDDENYETLLTEINEASAKLNAEVKARAKTLLDAGKMVGIVGGDHSTPLGLIQALAERYDSFGILQVDAHADLRIAYEGFTYSHASIMYNALNETAAGPLVQVGIRDYCEAEARMVEESQGRIISYYDQGIKDRQFKGDNWHKICQEIVAQLPENVYVSFDIDALDPKLCPNTGTPVPGGFDYFEAMHLIKVLATSGKKIIGFDLCEVAQGDDGSEWDGNVGARVLYRLASLMALSQSR